jgi:hypothetical protein
LFSNDQKACDLADGILAGYEGEELRALPAGWRGHTSGQRLYAALKVDYRIASADVCCHNESDKESMTADDLMPIQDTVERRECGN